MEDKQSISAENLLESMSKNWMKSLELKYIINEINNSVNGFNRKLDSKAEDLGTGTQSSRKQSLNASQKIGSEIQKRTQQICGV